MQVCTRSRNHDSRWTRIVLGLYSCSHKVREVCANSLQDPFFFFGGYVIYHIVFQRSWTTWRELVSFDHFWCPQWTNVDDFWFDRLDDSCRLRILYSMCTRHIPSWMRLSCVLSKWWSSSRPPVCWLLPWENFPLHSSLLAQQLFRLLLVFVSVWLR